MAAKPWRRYARKNRYLREPQAMRSEVLMESRMREIRPSGLQGGMACHVIPTLSSTKRIGCPQKARNWGEGGALHSRLDGNGPIWHRLWARAGTRKFRGTRLAQRGG